MLIKTKSHDKLKVGRLCLDINEMTKEVKVYPKDVTEPPPNKAEMTAIQKYLEVIRADIVNPGETLTGWSLESTMGI